MLEKFKCIHSGQTSCFRTNADDTWIGCVIICANENQILINKFFFSCLLQHSWTFLTATKLNTLNFTLDAIHKNNCKGKRSCDICGNKRMSRALISKIVVNLQSISIVRPIVRNKWNSVCTSINRSKRVRMPSDRCKCVCVCVFSRCSY